MILISNLGRSIRSRLKETRESESENQRDPREDKGSERPRMNQRQKQTLPRERAHKNAGAENWGAFNGPPRFAMGGHSAANLVSFHDRIQSDANRIYLGHSSLLGYNDTLLRKGAVSLAVAVNIRVARIYDRRAHINYELYTERTVLLKYIKIRSDIDLKINMQYLCERSFGPSK